LLSYQSAIDDPLTTALWRKQRDGRPGTAEGEELAAGEGWRVVDVVCTSGPRDRPFEERYSWASISLVVCGTFLYRTDHGSALMSPGAILLGSAGHWYECSHEHGEGDRCISFQFAPELLERIASDAGVSRWEFECGRIPPLRSLTPLAARAQAALARRDSFEELGLEVASAVFRLSGHLRPRPDTSARERARVAPVLRRLAASSAEHHALGQLAESAGLSRYHFLRTFKRVAGVTPHQYLLRARLREAAAKLAASAAPVTEVALDAGFDELSNFIRAFRAEFGVAPRHYRAAASGNCSS
jgi:AraC family transcriptional regulator